jgi:hypothetical protein
MAYLRHLKVAPFRRINEVASLRLGLKAFLGGLAGLAILAALSGANAQFEPKTTPFDLSDLREAGKGAPLSKNLKKRRQVLDNYYSRKLAALGINLRPGTEHREDSKATPVASKRCRSIVYQTLIKLPKEHRNQVQNLTLFYTKDGRRGLSGNGAVVLRCLNVTESELASVLVHEIGHLVDSGYLTGSPRASFSGFYDFDIPVSADDASALFYKITWNSEKERTAKTSEIDFVSLYAMTDPFEDFAETYTYYRLHGAEFRKLLQGSEPLRKKYEFMKWYVFSGEEFGEFVDREDINIWVRHYDVTVLPVS